MGEKKIGRIIVTGLLVLGVSASVVLGAASFSSQSEQNDKVNKYISDQLERQAEEQIQENTYEEDGFKVGEQYEIRSTKNISDAYISGDVSALSEEEKKTYDMAVEVIDKEITDDMSLYEKEVAIYEWMFNNIKTTAGGMISLPTSGGDTYTPYGVLTGKKAVCVGYATTFRMFMQMLGIECHVVHNSYHSWNLVKLDDGEWYHTDVYSDVSSNAMYQNFNMSDSVARNGHDWDGSALPAAEGVKYSYAVQHNERLSDIYDIPVKVKEKLDEGAQIMIFSFGKKLSDEELAKVNLMYTKINEAFYACGLYNGKDISATWYPDENGSYILGIFVCSYSQATAGVDDEEGRKIVDKVSETFGVWLDGGSDSGYTGDTGYYEENVTTEYMDAVG